MLNDLSPFENINSIGASLFIVNNDSLLSLSGLENIAPFSIIDLNIYNNLLLSICAVSSICDYLVEPNGTVEIHDNAPGCNNQQEVEDACWTLVDKMVFNDTFTISPNPLNSTTMIQYTLNQNSPITIKILDLSGREIITLVNEIQQQGEQKVVLNSDDLPTGVYFCVLITNEKIQTAKIIKL